jgi:hypothetical protein
MGARIVIQLLRIFLDAQTVPVENDFILAVEPRNLRDQGINLAVSCAEAASISGDRPPLR